MVTVREYIDGAGRSPFRKWFDGLDSLAAVKITVALERIASGHTSAMKALGDGVSEYRIDFGPGYRIYFGWDGEKLVILLAGETKKTAADRHQEREDRVAGLSITQRPGGMRWH